MLQETGPGLKSLLLPNVIVKKLKKEGISPEDVQRHYQMTDGAVDTPLYSKLYCLNIAQIHGKSSINIYLLLEDFYHFTENLLEFIPLNSGEKV